MSQTSNTPKTTFLKDYQPSPYLIKETNLTFDISKTSTVVKAELKIYRNPNVSEGTHDLILDGVELELLEVTVNYKPLATEFYTVNKEKLIIDQSILIDLGDTFHLQTKVLINPSANKTLMGLYVSGDTFCTQCEAEGFRRITYYIDRPDVLSTFTTTIIAPEKYTNLLSNGDLIEETFVDDLNSQSYSLKRSVTWFDPFPKPAYLFALVVGVLFEKSDTFITESGREITIRLFTEPQNRDKCDFALESVKRAMKWDEQKYSREYDLNTFMLVAVDDFNFGAMENKGLNIFNSSAILAHPRKTTDSSFLRIEAIIAHEYFHNWSGDRVTCRDWFQLSLKEGLTVFRDSEFTSDMHSESVKRIEDVITLRAIQFAEDAGPLAHPVRPDNYIKIDNFYTPTVYEKGAELIRMIKLIVGEQNYYTACNLYFQRFDGQAVTVEDFAGVMSEVSGQDLSQFMLWYTQAGTPNVTASGQYDSENQTYTLTLTQSCRSTPESFEKMPFLIPIKVGLLSKETCMPISLNPQGDETQVLHLSEINQTFTFEGIVQEPIPSLLQGFSAPVNLDYEYSLEELFFLQTHEKDSFNRWDATYKLSSKIIQQLQTSREPLKLLNIITRMFEQNINSCLNEDGLLNPNIDLALQQTFLSLPSMKMLVEEIANTRRVELDKLLRAHDLVVRHLSIQLSDLWLKLFNACSSINNKFDLSNEQIGNRALKNTALYFLVRNPKVSNANLALNQLINSNNMSDELSALTLLCHWSKKAEEAASLFYTRWSGDGLLFNDWIRSKVTSPSISLEEIEEISKKVYFSPTNPNNVNALLGGFASNYRVFHKLDGSGYKLLKDKIILIDKFNPSLSARLAKILTQGFKFDLVREENMLQCLKEIAETPYISGNLFEIASKGLNL